MRVSVCVTLPKAGWYPDPSEMNGAPRYWDGERWGATTPEHRRLALAGRVAHWVHLGYRLESENDVQAVVVGGHRPNHTLHLLLTIVTLGLWGIVWIIITISARNKRKTISISPEGYAIES